MEIKDFTKDIEILRIGDFTDSNGTKLKVTNELMDEVISNFNEQDPNHRRVPLVLGHPKHDDGAMAWTKYLRKEGDRVIANVGDFTEKSLETLKDFNGKSISVAMFGPGHSANPQKGKWSLKHLGHLAAKQPAISGLAPVQFAAHDEDTIITLESVNKGDSDMTDENKKLEEQVVALTAERDEANEKVANLEKQVAEFSAKDEDEKSDAEKRVIELQAEVDGLKAVNQKQADTAFVEKLISDAKLPVANKEVALAALENAGDKREAVVSFMEAQPALVKVGDNGDFTEAPDDMDKQEVAFTAAELEDEVRKGKTPQEAAAYLRSQKK